MMTLMQKFYRDQRAAAATEFALVVPVMILFMLGIIDTGRFIWNTNELEKAVQIGTRWAVATEYIPTELDTFSYATDATNPVPQGTVVPQSRFPGVDCSGNDSGVSCTCTGCPFDASNVNSAAFNRMVGRMNSIYAGIGNSNVDISYDWSGLGYSGDPNGSDVDPLVTVTVKNVGFRPIFLGGFFNFGLPDLSYTLTMEDGVGDFSN